MKALVLAIIPLFLLVLAILIRSQSGPYWLGTNSDPEYVYLLNSLNIATGYAPGYFSHPGTPLQILGAPVLEITALFRHPKSLVDDVLINPEIYLNSLNYFLLTLLVLTVFSCGILVYRLTGSLIPALLLQVAPFLSSIPLLVMHRVSPEPLLLIIGFWFSYLLLYFFITQKTAGIKAVFLFSLLTGFSAALKINSLPLAVIPLILLSKKNVFRYLVLSFTFFIIFTLPAVSLYPQMFVWFKNMVIHTGNYGTGAAGFVSLPLFLNNLSNILLTQPFLLLILLVNLILLIRFYKPRLALNWYKYIFGITLYFVLQLLLISKHFNFRYLVPPASLFGFMAVILFYIRKSARAVLLGLVILVSLVNFNVALQSVITVNPDWYEQQAIQKLINQKYKDGQVFYYYGSSSPAFALKYANDNAGRIYTDKLAALYPGNYFYNLGFNTFSDWKTKVILPVGKTILLEGVPFTGDYLLFRPLTPVTDLFFGQTETLYRLR
jgi:hypothetical protein